MDLTSDCYSRADPGYERMGKAKSSPGASERKNRTKTGPCRIRRMEKTDWPALLGALDSDRGSGAWEWHNFSEADADVEFGAGDEWTKGFYVAEDTQTGQLLGHVFAVAFGTRHAYIGGYYAHSPSSDTDSGLALLQSAIDLLKGRNIMADFRSADLAVPKYETEILSQFKEADWRILRYVGVPNWEHLPSMANQQLYVCHAQMIRVEEISQFDRTISGQDRTAWLRRFLRHSNEGWIPKSAQLVVTDRRGEIRGYGCVRPGSCRARIGPIYARDSKTFLLLFRNLMGSSREARTRGVDVAVSSSNRQAIDVMERVLDLRRLRIDEESQELRRFYTKWHPHVLWEQAYCLTNCVTQFV